MGRRSDSTPLGCIVTVQSASRSFSKGSAADARGNQLKRPELAPGFARIDRLHRPLTQLVAHARNATPTTTSVTRATLRDIRVRVSPSVRTPMHRKHFTPSRQRLPASREGKAALKLEFDVETRRRQIVQARHRRRGRVLPRR